MPTDTAASQWESVQSSIATIRKETARVIIGQDAIVEQMLVSVLCQGHCLIVGVPGLAKTLLASTIGHILGLKFQRIQFTPRSDANRHRGIRDPPNIRQWWT